jgi:hypothetical protein
MASVRTAVRQRALQLAHSAEYGTADEMMHVPARVIEQLRSAAHLAEEPASTLRWAWRSQHANYLGSRRRADGLATVYLLAALLADEDPAT